MIRLVLFVLLAPVWFPSLVLLAWCLRVRLHRDDALVTVLFRLWMGAMK